MKFRELSLPGVWLIEAELHTDERGVFRRHFCGSEYAAHGLVPTVAQGNVSENPHLHTLRGFHYQSLPHSEAKTLSCFSGSLFDIVVDLRPSSSHFMKWVAVEISAPGRESLYVPPGFANAWLTTSPGTVVHYYMSEVFSPGSEHGIRYDDPAFEFRWPAVPKVISARDRSFSNFDVGALHASTHI